VRVGAFNACIGTKGLAQYQLSLTTILRRFSSALTGLDVDGELPPGSIALKALDGKRLYPSETTGGVKPWRRG